MSERWRIEPEYAMKVDRSLGLLGVLLEPTTVVTKAWEQVAAVGQRAFWEPRNVLVTGAGPIGLLAALLGKQRGLDVHVLDRVETGTKPDLVRALGATYHTGTSRRRLPARRRRRVHGRRPGHRGRDPGRGRGWRRVSHGRRERRPRDGLPIADVAAEMVLRNNVIVGSVNANKRHWYKAGEALAHADRAWLARLVTRRAKPAGVCERAPARSRTTSRSSSSSAKPEPQAGAGRWDFRNSLREGKGGCRSFLQAVGRGRRKRPSTGTGSDEILLSVSTSARTRAAGAGESTVRPSMRLRAQS